MDGRNQCISTKAKSRRAWTSFAGRGSPVSHIVKPAWPADCSATGLGEGSPALGSRGEPSGAEGWAVLVRLLHPPVLGGGYVLAERQPGAVRGGGSRTTQS